jgi:Skp family chaperone for outer membrane proteins
MKKFGIIFLSILLLSLTGTALAVDTAKVGIIDMQKFQQESKKFQKVRADLKKKFESLQKKPRKSSRSRA